MKIKELYQYFLGCTDVVIDSRKITEDSIFFALKGANFDGNIFAENAIKMGAKYAVVDNPEIAQKSKQFILVNNVLKALQDLAQYHRSQINIPVIGITGTNGKTTTKELLKSVLDKRFNTLATEGNYNNHIGVPLTLLRLNHKHEMAIIEMGANHLGEIAMLCEIAMPTIGLITNVGLAHLEGFKSFNNIVETKSALYHSVFKNKGTNFLLSENIDLSSKFPTASFVEYSNQNSQKLFYGYAKNTSKELVFKLEKIDGEDVNYSIHTQLIGAYNESNILSAITIGYKMGVSISDIVYAIEHYKPENNRSQVKQTTRNTLILDAYNANPSSVELAIKNFKTIDANNKMLILGDMLELGDYESIKHQEITNLLVDLGFKNVILIGKAFGQCKHSFNSFADIKSEELKVFLNTIHKHVILIKGSRGMQLERLVDLL